MGLGLLRDVKYLVLSLLAHSIILFALVLGFSFSSPIPVLKNSNKQDVISAVILGETPDSKILPQEVQPPPPPLPPVQVKPESPAKPIPVVDKRALEEEAIALKLVEKKKMEEEKRLLEEKKRLEQKKLAEQKALQAKKQQQLFAKDLLADIRKTHDRHKKLQQKKLQTHFAKTLKTSAESSLRQQLFDEEIRLKSQQERLTQGIINKYQALIVQAISEHWIVPPQANKKLYCELMIRLTPGGSVLEVQVTKTSGDFALDRSARAAVLKASPLPVPKETKTFEHFRQFVLKVRPENILTNPNLLGSS